MSRRERQHVNTQVEIKTTARQQMAESGTAALSLNAIARQMEMTTPALYRYYASRDELVTALIVDAFNDLTATLEAAPRGIAAQEYAQRLMAVLVAYRDWALAHPIDFELIYGNPIPGYRAPEDATRPAAERGFLVILEILSGAMQAGVLKPLPEQQNLPEGLYPLLPPAAGEMPDWLPVVYYIGMVGWYHIHGMIMLELFHHNTDQLSSMDLFYRHEVAAFMRSVGLDPRTG
jgi:AcrR family transcriptional regulator